MLTQWNNKTLRIITGLIVLLFQSFLLQAQNDLENLLNEVEPKNETTVHATFKNTHVLNGHSVELMKPGELEFRISHRFGRLNTGAYELWGLDQANIHFAFEYGLSDRINVGFGRGTYQKSYDGFFKAKLVSQKQKGHGSPVSVVYFSSMSMNTLKQPALQDYFSNRLAYTHAILIARKFSKDLSLQFSPHFVHRNFVESSLDLNDLFSLGFGGRYKLTNRISLNFEYFFLIRPLDYYPELTTRNPLSIGFDIETGGHVFQLHFTNSLAMIEKGFIGETTGNWFDGDIHFGFNISRVFTIR